MGNSVIYLDTHALVWLYSGEPDRLGRDARKAINDHEPLVSPAAILELQLLHEIGRLRPTAGKLIAALESEIGLRTCTLPFHAVASHALNEGWTRDPFDRLIVANAKAARARLATKDATIHSHFSGAVW
jgi:PIN domain nuclease of toxin-antitoxin system